MGHGKKDFRSGTYSIGDPGLKGVRYLVIFKAEDLPKQPFKRGNLLRFSRQGPVGV